MHIFVGIQFLVGGRYSRLPEPQKRLCCMPASVQQSEERKEAHSAKAGVFGVTDAGTRKNL